MPNALRALMRAGARVDALLCPGHVASITGAEAFRFLPEDLHLPAAISGFEPEELLMSILALVTMLQKKAPGLVNAYPRIVKPNPNETARALVDEWFVPCDAIWRGLGNIPQSGLALRPEHEAYDAVKRFHPAPKPVSSANGCRCGDVLRGSIEPPECPLFGTICVPKRPLGACMVSSEGACAAYYQYEGTGI